MVLKKNKQPKTFEDNKYYIDLNKLENKSRSRLMFVFEYITKKELKWKDKKIQSVNEELMKKIEFPALTKAMNEYIGDHAVFYYGPGDSETQYLVDKNPTKGDPNNPPKKGGRPKGSKNKSTQDSFNENLRSHIAKDYGLKE